MVVSDCHFKQAMAGSAKSDQVLWTICLVLVLELTAAFDVMNVQTTPAGAAPCSAVLAYLVTATYVLTNGLPVSSVRQFFAAPVVWAILASHKLKGTFARAKTTPILGCALERAKGLSAILTVQIHGCYQAIIGTPSRAMPNRGVLLIKPFSASGAIDIDHLGTTPSRMALTGTKDVFHILAGSVWLSLKRLPAMVASQCDCLTERVYRALSRAVIDGFIIGLELVPALEASLDH